MIRLPFADRIEAGRLLAAELATHKLPANVVVLALPRGGLPVASAGWHAEKPGEGGPKAGIFVCTVSQRYS